MSNDYFNPFDSNRMSNLNSATPSNIGENYRANYRHISNELDEDRVEIQGQIKKKKTGISFGKNIQKAAQEGAQFIGNKVNGVLSGGFKKAFDELSIKFKNPAKLMSQERIITDLQKILTSKKTEALKELTQEQITAILQKANKNNVSLIKKLAKDEGIDAQDFERFVASLNDLNLPLAQKLYSKKTNAYDVISVLNSTTQENIEARFRMYDFLRKNTKISSNIDILASVDEKNIDSKIRMYNFLKGKVEEYNIASSEILHSTTEKNIEAKLEAYDFFKSIDVCSQDELLLYLTYVNKFDDKTKELVSTMMKSGYDYGYYIHEILCDSEISKIKLEMFDFLKGLDSFSDFQRAQFLSQMNKRTNIPLAKKLCLEGNFSPKSITKFLTVTENLKPDEALELVNNPKIKTLLADDSLVSVNNYNAITKLSTADLESIDELFKRVETCKVNALKNPQLYINGEFDTLQDAQNEVEIFFNANKIALAKMFTVLDKEAINNILRMRFDDADGYIKKFLYLSAENKKLLNELLNSCNVDGKPLMPTQKIELIDLLLGYKQNDLSKDKMLAMIEEGKIDIPQLNLDLLGALLKKCGLTQDEIANIPSEKLIQWDVNHIHLLASEIRGDSSSYFKDILKVSNLGDFRAYILDESNKYGQANAKTKKMFNKYGLNYQAWINPEVISKTQFQMKDKNQERLAQIAGQIIEDIEALRQTPARTFVDKQFAQFLDGDKFVIPEEYLTSKAKLAELTQNLLKQLDGVFKRAQGNINNPSKAATAQSTLTIKSHLNQRLGDISQVSDSKSTRTLDLTIKMWDRVPQKDIFQGNYSTCCIGMGGGNGAAMPNYLLNTAYNMIEVVDNKTNKTIGNALCYFVVDKLGKPILVIDNIEIANSKKPSDEVGVELRNAILQYAKNIVKEVNGSKNTKIYMSGSYNDVPCEDLRSTKQLIKFLGETECDEIYMDAYDGWVDKSQYKSKLKLLKLGDSKS